MSCAPTLIAGGGECGVITVATPGPPGPPGAPGSASFTQPVLVANLPTPVSGSRSIVSDCMSSAFYAQAVGGGSITIPVFADAVAGLWRIG